MSAATPRPCACAAAQRVPSATPAPDTCAVVVAGGLGLRFGDPRGKQFVELCGLPIVCWSLLAIDRSPSVGHIVVVCAPEREEVLLGEALSRVRLSHEVSVAPAGATRQESVLSGLGAVPRDYALVAIHDAARPLVTADALERCIARVRDDDAVSGAICATPSTDTLKLVEDKTIISTPDRSFYWCAQTPQVFGVKELAAAHTAALLDDYRGTDDASLVERCGGRVVCVNSPRDNIKVTVPEDYVIAEGLLERRLISEGCGPDILGGREGASPC